ncbi:hypothetical protein HCN44_005601 [Aphidius gifuensis]|uniref:Uncharacterized protein n=1 Tax=Aphidius gifuensis TaxID=684658 RepID=A0A835CVK7_APHGI|nr:zinc finger protein 502-like [Aphidius gifuensis]KAF7997324.1 hypothetical protein HCN44_005601 [Aphidius gifuensis]
MEVTRSEALINNEHDNGEFNGHECRICLKKSIQVWQVFENYGEIPRKIMACAAVKVEQGDGLPSVICHNCRQLLDVSYEFKCQVEQSDAKFRHILEYRTPIYENQITNSLSDSINAVITEAISGEHTLHQDDNEKTVLINLDNQKKQIDKPKTNIKISYNNNESNNLITDEIKEENYNIDNYNLHENKIEINFFKCQNCHICFKSDEALQQHMIIHDIKYSCYMCNEEFTTNLQLEKHIELHEATKLNNDKLEKNNLDEKNDVKDNKIFKFSCEYCSNCFKYEKSYLTHVKKHPEYKKNNKNKKKQVNFDDDDDDNYNDDNDDDNSMPIQCKQCGKIYATQRNLKRHMLTHSGQKFICKICDKSFSRIDKLKEHEHSKHNDKFFGDSDDIDDGDDDDNYENGKKILNTNEKKEKPKRPHSCPICPRAFALAQSLNNHVERHKRIKETQKRFLCEVCSKCFAQSGSLVAHMRTHTGVKPYVCNVCNRAFTKSTYLQLHLRTHSGEKPYICQYCSRAFARANTLARHLTMHTGEAKYRCRICTKSFRRLTSLNEHTYTHTGQRPYACKICTKRYNNAGSLYAHTKKCKAMQSDNTCFQETSNPQESSNSSVILYMPKRIITEEVEEGAEEGEEILDTINVTDKVINTIVDNIDNQQKNIDININNINSSVTNPDVKSSYYTIYPV